MGYGPLLCTMWYTCSVHFYSSVETAFFLWVKMPSQILGHQYDSLLCFYSNTNYGLQYPAILHMSGSLQNAASILKVNPQYLNSRFSSSPIRLVFCKREQTSCSQNSKTWIFYIFLVVPVLSIALFTCYN